MSFWERYESMVDKYHQWRIYNCRECGARVTAVIGDYAIRLHCEKCGFGDYT